MEIAILIADDQTLMRDGLKAIIDIEEDMEVVANLLPTYLGFIY